MTIWQKVRRAREEEAGFTVVEMVITSAVLLIVLAMLFTTLSRLTAMDARTRAIAENQDEIRVAIEKIGREVRAANPFQPKNASGLRPTASSSSFRLALGPTTAAQTIVEWKYDSATKELRRYVLPDANSALTAATSTLVVLKNVTAPAVGVFTYYCLSGTELTQLSPSDADFTSRMHIAFSGGQAIGPKSFTVQDDINLRNKSEEVC
jgi:type II secretory pathway pseudopilin PulG